MKKTILMSMLATVIFTTSAMADDDDFDLEPMCKVVVCNKIERFSLDIWSHVKDAMGETCMEVVIPKRQAIEGEKLTDESRWYQGSSFNPTKRSITRVNKVLKCQKD